MLLRTKQHPSPTTDCLEQVMRLFRQEVCLSQTLQCGCLLAVAVPQLLLCMP